MANMANNSKVIPQQDLERFYKLSKAVEEYKLLEKQLVEAVDAGARPAAGRYGITVSESVARRTPAWKDEAIKLAIEAGLDEKLYVDGVMCVAPLSAVNTKVKPVDTHNLKAE